MKPEELKQKLQGIWTILITPFKDNYEIDVEGFKKNIDFCVNNGVNGVVIGGSLGEFSSLTMEERYFLTKEGVKAVAGRVPAIVTTAHSCLDDAIKFNQYAKEVGADGVMMTAPYYCCPPEIGIYDFFKEVTSKTDMPILIYNTSRAGVNLSPKFISKLANLPNIIGVKQGTRNAPESFDTVALAGDRINVLSGSEEVMLQNYSIGMVGTTAVSSGFMPKVFIDIYNAVQNNDFVKARDLFDKLGKYHRLVREVGQPATAKAAMSMVGLESGPIRTPMVSIPEEKVAELRGILIELGLNLIK